MEDLTNESKLELSKKALDSFVDNFEPKDEASKKFAIALLQLLLGRRGRSNYKDEE